MREGGDDREEMVGLSILLEAQKSINRTPQVINKFTIIKSSSSSCYSSSPLPAIRFLEACFLCKQKLLTGKDIYMYKGDRAFCSGECRCRQIFMDEEESIVGKENCALAAIKPYSSSSSGHDRKGTTRNRPGGFAN